MKLLIITYSYTPDLTPRAFRWSSIADHLAKSGHEVHVLCASAADKEMDAAAARVAIYRVRDWLLNTFSRVAAVTPAACPDALRERGRYAARSIARNVIRFFWRMLYWPDYACGWVIPATRMARELCATNSYDWIISVSHPFSGHVVGGLAKASLPGVRWFVDIGDPFSLMKEPAPNNRFVYGWISRVMEARVLGSADVICVTTDTTRLEYERNFNLPSGKICVVPPLLSLPDLPVSASTAAVRGDVIRLVFVGTLYRKLRSPHFLLRCFAELLKKIPDRRLELHFYGAINDCAEEFAQCPNAVKSALHVHGLVARGEVARAMVKADILVNIGNDSETQLASKIIEYMAVGKPILNIESNRNNVSSEALLNYPSLLTVIKSVDFPPSELLDNLCRFVLTPPPVDTSCVEQIRLRYSGAAIATQYENMLKNCPDKQG